jgi:predicted DCC family thiol-disulfide oxidoreductase YuxK
MIRDELKHQSILLFDGYCNFCSSTVQFIFEHEKNRELHFASLQSPTGMELLKHYQIDPSTTDSLVLIEHDKAYVKSAAGLRITKYLKGLYPMLMGFIVVPPFIRNVVYDYIARNRYKWFGKSESCMLPDKELAKRFL